MTALYACTTNFLYQEKPLDRDITTQGVIVTSSASSQGYAALRVGKTKLIVIRLSEEVMSCVLPPRWYISLNCRWRVPSKLYAPLFDGMFLGRSRPILASANYYQTFMVTETLEASMS